VLVEPGACTRAVLGLLRSVVEVQGGISWWVGTVPGLM
jgi:hypothetical protein